MHPVSRIDVYKRQGVNAQKRCVAIHHLDCPWRPSDLEQRDGRGIRTGKMCIRDSSTAKEGTEFTVLSTEKFDGREKAEAARAEVIGARTVRVVNVEMCIRDRDFTVSVHGKA